MFLLASVASSRGTIVYTYDFPGTPTGSGRAADQTNPAPPFTKFLDWNRVGLMEGTMPDVWDSTGFSTGGKIDTTQYTSFSIMADDGWHLNIQSFKFDQQKTKNGPKNGRVEMFVNGTLFDTFNYGPTANFSNKNANFKSVDKDNATTVEFRFYGWNASVASDSLLLDNVAITLDVIPEWDAGAISAIFLAAILAHSLITKRRTQLPVG
ncbi:MAG TPA: hypothetical protein VGM62_02600 [Chthoniobacterales bacterium]